MGKLLVFILSLLSPWIWADEKLLNGFESADLGRINMKMREGASCIRGRVAAIPSAGMVTLSMGIDKRVVLGYEFIILHMGVYAGDVKVTRVDSFTAIAKVVAGVQPIVTGDSVIQSVTVHDTLKGNVTLPIPGQGSTWYLLRGNASQGEYAMGLTRVRTPTERPLFPYTPSLTADSAVWRYYGMFQNGGWYLNTCGYFRAIFPKDWSNYDLLRLDVYAKGVTQRVQVAIEDEEIAPMAERNFQAPAGSWVTLEFDLRLAVQERKLDLRKMTGLHVAVREAPGKSVIDTCCLLDNIRLATTGSPVTLPVVKDQTTMALPAYFLHNTTPVPETLPTTPDRATLPLDTPRVILSDSGICFGLTGFISAYDNKNLIAGFTKTGQRWARQLATNDGGFHWTGLQGEAGPTQILGAGPYESCGRGEVSGGRGDVLLLISNCSGGGHAGMRIAAYKFIFDGTRWNRTLSFLESDTRHCIEIHTAAKTPDGRLWTSVGLASRLGTLAINVHYSDNDGLSWKPSRENTAGLIPWSLVQTVPDTQWRASSWAYGVSTEPNALVSWGNNSVACLVQTLQRPGQPLNSRPVYWMRLEGNQWSAPEQIPISTMTHYYTATFPRVKAVSLNNNEIFLVASQVDGIFHYKDGAWTHEALTVPFNSALCVAGGNTVVAVGAINPGDDRKVGPVILRSWQYRNGSWSAPIDVAREEKPLVYSMNVNVPGFYIPASSPPNFVPLAWCKPDTLGKVALKFVRIPVDTTTTNTEQEGSSAILLQAALQALPNPFSRTVQIRYATDAKATIFDVNGKCVWQAGFTTEQPRLQWDSRAFAHGIYILKIVAANRQVKTLKLIKL